MAKKTTPPKLTDAQQVDAWVKALKHPFKNELEEIRSIIKSADKEIHERIKWNAPSYYCTQDMVTFGPLRKKDEILLVFHHPHIVKIKSDLLQGDYKDRRLAYFYSMAEIKSAKKELIRIVKELAIKAK
jgi:hypothetical protein